MTLRVGFDLDGVLYDFGNSVVRYLSSIGIEVSHKDGAPEPHHWDFYEHWGMSREEFAKHCHDGADAGYVFCGGVRPNAVQAVREVKSMGHKVVVITDRQFGSTPSVSHENTKRWWIENEFPMYDELHFSSDKTIVPTDIFVEDKYENAVALEKAGTPCMLINRPWNRTEPVHHTYQNRINDISEYPFWVGVTDVMRRSQFA